MWSSSMCPETEMAASKFIHALAPTEADLDLTRVTEFIYGQESGRESRKLLSGAAALITVSATGTDRNTRNYRTWRQLP